MFCFPFHLFFITRYFWGRVAFSPTFIIYLLDHYFRFHGCVARERSKNAKCGDSFIYPWWMRLRISSRARNGGAHKSGIKNNRRQPRALFIFCVGRNNLTDTCRGNIQVMYTTHPACARVRFFLSR
jgi:hypothetical protein